ncbi:MAG TPA: hypothetical protein VK843_21580 [Planctomycetota bacterium]|nr:hypothetical protein [Planctomycetota bacterium]
MNNSTTTWLLAGALAASLAWNAKPWILPNAQVAPVPATTCLAEPDLSGLELSPDQQRALESWRANSCGPGCLMQSEAEAGLAQLHAALRDPSATAESLHELATKINDLRAQSLEVCIDSILEVRRVLTPEQLERLMGCCGGEALSKP